MTNRNQICFFLQFPLNKIKNKNTKPQYNKKDHHRLRDIIQLFVTLIPGKIFSIKRLKAKRDHTIKKLVKNSFNEIFFC